MKKALRPIRRVAAKLLTDPTQSVILPENRFEIMLSAGRIFWDTTT
jgi:hypothetical protein